jgi:hypothetical protein
VRTDQLFVGVAYVKCDEVGDLWGERVGAARTKLLGQPPQWSTNIVCQYRNRSIRTVRADAIMCACMRENVCTYFSGLLPVGKIDEKQI